MRIIITEEQKNKLFIPRRLSGENSKWLEWNNHQPVKVIDGEEIKINQKNSDGLKQGVWEEYAPNGEIFAVGPYIDNEKNGEWKVYNTKENRLDRILTFKNDRLVKKIPIY